MSYLGYKKEDYNAPYAKYFNDNLAEIQGHIPMALVAALAKDSLPPLADITDLLKSGYQTRETGYCMAANGELRVSVLTKMPRVSPEMWHWWFGWHGCESNRYKLWHPKAHLCAEWKDKGTQIAYVNRTSEIEEYIGTSLEKAAIQFVEPSVLGFNPMDYADRSQNVFICARLGYRDYPLDFGWLVHHIRKTDDGAEMRSRFFMGGQHIHIRQNGFFSTITSSFLQKIVRLSPKRGHDLLLHCAEEMNHLAKVLPDIFIEMT